MFCSGRLFCTGPQGGPKLSCVGLLLVAGCASAPPRMPSDFVFAIGYADGLQVSRQYFFGDGTMTYETWGRRLPRRTLEQAEQDRLQAVLDAPAFAEAVDGLRATGHSPRRSHDPEVFISPSYSASDVGYLVCADSGEEMPIAFVVRFVNSLGRKYYPRKFKPFPVLACVPLPERGAPKYEVPDACSAWNGTRAPTSGRYYSSHLGQFLSQDRVEGTPASPQSWNRYGYVLNNPLKFVDPDGEFAIEAALFAALVAGTAPSKRCQTLARGSV